MASSFTPFSSQTTLVITIFTTIFILSHSSLSSASPSTNGKHHHHNHRPRPFKKIYAFGDSFTDTGNTILFNRPKSYKYVSKLPYGITFFHHPSHRYSDGRLVIDFVAEALSLPFLPPYLNHTADTSHGVNFAVAGCTAISYDFFVKKNITFDITPQSLHTQLFWFDKILESQGCRGEILSRRKCNAVFDDALIWVGEIGVNDNAYTIGSSVSASTVQELSIKSVTGFLQALLKKGAKYIVVQGQPPTGCLPLAMELAPEEDRDDMGCVGSVNKQNYNYNTILQAKLHNLRLQFPHAVIVYADYWNAYHTVMKNAHNYGFMEPFRACCGSGQGPYNFDLFAICGAPNTSSCAKPWQYIHWDGIHLTEALYKVVSEMFMRGTFCHPSFDYLLSRKRHRLG